jgi:hypothetical protein
MKIESLREEIIKKVNSIEDKSFLIELEQLLQNSDEKEFWNELPEEVKSKIELGRKEISEGRFFDHEEIQKEVKNRFFRS